MIVYSNLVNILDALLSSTKIPPRDILVTMWIVVEASFHFKWPHRHISWTSSGTIIFKFSRSKLLPLEMKNCCVFALLFTNVCFMNAIQKDTFFAFGLSEGDSVLQEGDDEVSEALKINKPLQFYDVQFNILYVSHCFLCHI